MTLAELQAAIAAWKLDFEGYVADVQKAHDDAAAFLATKLNALTNRKTLLDNRYDDLVTEGRNLEAAKQAAIAAEAAESRQAAQAIENIERIKRGNN